MEVHLRACRLTLVGEHRDGIDPLGSEGMVDVVSQEDVSEEVPEVVPEGDPGEG